MLIKPPLEIAKAVIKSLADFDAPTRKDVMKTIRKTIKNTNYAFPTSIQLWEAYRELLQEGLEKNENIERALRVKDVRTDSGVAPITVLTKPYPCPGNCVYCPTEYRMPKSYISSEPAAARALSLEFDPYEQVKQRVQALERNGHTANKIELIVKGGTWSAYPQDYREWFITRCFEAANELGETGIPLSLPLTRETCSTVHGEIMPYDSDLTELAKQLRNNQTPAEEIFWQELLKNDKTDFKFLRQKPLDNFIVDFYCSKLMLAIEIDGEIHSKMQEADIERTYTLEDIGVKVIRYKNEEIFNNLENVKNDLLNQIQIRLKELQAPLSKRDKNPGSPLSKGVGGISEVQLTNETATYRIIGLTIETRPDHITPDEVIHLRNLGVTRVELGLQIINDRVLKLTGRGTTVADAEQAIALLKAAAFKVDVHILPGQPGATHKDDLESFKLLFDDPRFRPDMIKLYPCVVLPNSELHALAERGDFKPLEGEDLRELLIEMQSTIPYYCRVSRLIRDFPAGDISHGNKQTNLRESIESEMKRRGIFCKCLRCREVAHVPGDHTNDKTQLFEERYENAGGTEIFLSIENENRTAVFGFCRLRLPQPSLVKRDDVAKGNIWEILEAFPILKTSAQIRELHTYGTALNINQQDKDASQHKGYGKKLMARAEEIATKEGYKNIAVISGIGVREYYKTLDYHEIDTYMVKELKNSA